MTPAGPGRWTVEGDLTVRGVTRPVVLDATFEGGARDPVGRRAVGFSANAELDREDFGLTWNQALETGGVLVGKAVKIEIEAEAVRQSSASPCGRGGVAVDAGWKKTPESTGCSSFDPQGRVPSVET